MKLVRMFLTIIALLSISASSPAPEPAEAQVVDAGFTQAVTGMNGWYLSDVTITALSPVVADGKLLQPGEILTISNESEQRIEYTSPDRKSTAAQIIRIDKTAPLMTINDLYHRGDGATILSVSVIDVVSGPAALDTSLDNGLTWQTYPVSGDGSVPEVVWDIEVAPDSTGPILARAVDVAGNTSVIVKFIGAVK